MLTESVQAKKQTRIIKKKKIWKTTSPDEAVE